MQATWKTCARFWSSLTVLQQLVVGYLSYVLTGWLILLLPICHEQPGLSALDHLFMAASAVSTTGLVTINTADGYSFLGELVLILLIQAGGLGYMTISSFLLLAVSKPLSAERQQLNMAALSLPVDFDVSRFVRLVCWYTLIVEAVGALALWPVFADKPFGEALWTSVFHSISAFCTAGFGLFNNSFEDYRGNVWLNGTLIVLSELGAMGFLVVNDVWRSLQSRELHVTFTTRVILWSTAILTVAGTVLFWLEEPAVRTVPWQEAWLASLFQVMTAQTTVGFNTVPIGALSASSVMLLTLMMLIGASPAGTGGGMKTTTISALWGHSVSVLRRRPVTSLLGRVIPEARLRAAVANAVFYLGTLGLGVYLLTLVESSPFVDQFFECASALGTVGLSRGITGSLTPLGKCIIIALMLLGRAGPLVVGMSLIRPLVETESSPTEDVVV